MVRAGRLACAQPAGLELGGCAPGGCIGREGTPICAFCTHFLFSLRHFRKWQAHGVFALYQCVFLSVLPIMVINKASHAPLLTQVRAHNAQLIARAYSSIEPSKAAALLGLPEAQAV